MRGPRHLDLAGLALAFGAGGASGQCQPAWSDVFTPPFMTAAGPEASVTLFDDGTGMKLVVSDLRRRGDPDAGLQVWDGLAWSTLTDPQFDLSGNEMLGADNDSPSPRLFMTLGGWYTAEDVLVLEQGVWRSTNYPLQTGAQTIGDIEADPYSDDMYIDGLFRNTGQWTKVIRWDGQSWTALDRDGTAASSTSLTWFDDGTGPALHAGMRNKINGVPAAGVAKWDGLVWSEVGGGCPAYWPSITAHDDGTESALWAIDLHGVMLAKWDRVSWTSYPLEARDVSESWPLLSVNLHGSRELMWLDRRAAGSEIWRWDGVDGEPVGVFSLGKATDFIPDNSGALGGGVFAVGDFRLVGDTPAACVAVFDGTDWTPVGASDIGNGAIGPRALLRVEADGAHDLGGFLYVAADAAGGEATGGVATWDGSRWRSIGPASMSTGSVQRFAFGDLGAGARVFAGGSVQPDGAEGGAVIAWDGQFWSVVADGIADGSIETMAFGAVAGGEPMLFVGGTLNNIDGAEYHSVAAIGAGGWVPLGVGLPGQSGEVDRVSAMVIHDDGAGTALYAGGALDHVDPALADGVVRWSGSEWARVGEPLDSAAADVAALCSADLGDGPRLYAGGRFAGPNGDLQNIAMWDGSAWLPLADGLPSAVNALAQIGTDNGPRLAAACSVSTGGEHPEQVWLWDGASWTPFGAEADGAVRGLAQAGFDGDAVYLAGDFHQVAGTPSEGLARYGCPPCPADFNHDSTLDTRDFIAYLAAWAAGDHAADFDANGTLDTRDFIAYLGAWAAGC
jgi:hypothetical protein